MVYYNFKIRFQNPTYLLEEVLVFSDSRQQAANVAVELDTHLIMMK